MKYSTHLLCLLLRSRGLPSTVRTVAVRNRLVSGILNSKYAPPSPTVKVRLMDDVSGSDTSMTTSSTATDAMKYQM
ncbi:MAG: hypothetical protein J7J11_00975 [Desulfurococcales archaeon]|nr:hypothetical protein [Desulfurococcales archaeon]